MPEEDLSLGISCEQTWCEPLRPSGQSLEHTWIVLLGIAEVGIPVVIVVGGDANRVGGTNGELSSYLRVSVVIAG